MIGLNRESFVVTYPMASQHEVCALENMWREKVFAAQLQSLAFVFYRHLPIDVVRLIATKMHMCHKERACHVLSSHSKGRFKLEKMQSSRHT